MTGSPSISYQEALIHLALSLRISSCTDLMIGRHSSHIWQYT